MRECRGCDNRYFFSCGDRSKFHFEIIIGVSSTETDWVSIVCFPWIYYNPVGDNFSRGKGATKGTQLDKKTTRPLIVWTVLNALVPISTDVRRLQTQTAFNSAAQVYEHRTDRWQVKDQGELRSLLHGEVGMMMSISIAWRYAEIYVRYGFSEY